MKILAKHRLKAYSDEYLSPIDQAIKDYVSSEMFAYKLHEYIDEAIEKYPNRRSMTLYRGLNFLNKEHYDSFIKTISNGKITLNSFSSWTTSKRVAEGFANTRKFTLDLGFVSKDDPYWKAYEEATKKKDPLVGYRGVVLITHIPANVGLDMTEAGYGSEEEVVLPKGTYNIKYYDVLSYSDKYKNKDPNEILTKLIKIGNTNQIKAVFEFLQANGLKPTDLSTYVRHYLFTKTISFLEIAPYVSIKRKHYDKEVYFGVVHKDVIYGSAISGNAKYEVISLLDWFTDSDYSKLKILFKSSLKKMLEQIEDLSEKYPEYPIIINNTTLKLANEFNISQAAYDLMRQYYKPNYEKLQDKGRQVNQIKDYRERKEFLNNYMDELTVFLKTVLSN